MFAHKWFRLLFGSSGFLVWLAMYLVARFGGRDVRSLKTPILIVAVPLFGAWIAAEAADRSQLVTVFSLNFWGLYGAYMWLRGRDKGKASYPFTTLDLTREASSDATRAEVQERH
jgi:hypothetical protein